MRINKKGNELVEAGIALPVIILAVMLLIRMFTFYLEILDTQISAHEDALEKSEEYSDEGIIVYEDEENVHLLRGGLLGTSLKKTIKTRAYFVNEDMLVKADEIVGR